MDPTENCCTAEPEIGREVSAPRRPLLVAFATFGLAWGAWGAALPAVQVRTGLSDQQLGLALLAVAAGALPAMRATPTLLARWRRTLLPVLSISLIASFALATAMTSGIALTAALLLVGAISGAHDVAMNTTGSTLERRRGQPVLQLAHATFSLAVVAAGISVGAARQIGVPAPVAVVVVAAIVIVATVVQRDRSSVTSATETSAPASDPAAPASVDETDAPASDPAAIVPDVLDLDTDALASGSPRSAMPHRIDPRVYLVLGGVALIASLVENALQSWSALHLERSLSAPPFYGGLAAAAFALGAAAGRLAAHRFGDRRSLRGVLAVAGGIAATSILIATVTGRPMLALVAIVLAGAAVSTVLPAVLSAAGGGAASEAAAPIARIAMIGYLGFLVGPPFVGAIAEATSLRVAFAVLAGIVLVIPLLASLHRAAPPTHPA